MKDHRRETKTLDTYVLDGTPDEVIAYIAGECEGLIDPRIEGDYEYGYYAGEDRYFRLYIHHWVPLTEKEIAKRDRDEAKAIEDEKKRKKKIREDEFKTYQRLHKKYGDK